VTSFEIDAKDGSLTAADTATTGAAPHSVAVSGDGAYLYTGASGAAAYNGFTISSKTGALKALKGFSAKPGGAPEAALVDPSGLYLVSVQSDVEKMISYVIQSDGSLVASAGGKVGTGSFPRGLVFEPNGEAIYVVNSGNDRLTGYSIDPSTGDLAVLKSSPFDTGNTPLSIAITPSGNYVYAGDKSGIRGFARNASNGKLIELDTSPFLTLGRPGALAIDPSGKTMIVCDPSDDIVRMVLIDNDTGALTKADDSPEAAGRAPRAVLIVTP
jgi:6-phosphogluconolactonase (cycloisomerase 2 family)